MASRGASFRNNMGTLYMPTSINPPVTMRTESSPDILRKVCLDCFLGRNTSVHSVSCNNVEDLTSKLHLPKRKKLLVQGEFGEP